MVLKWIIVWFVVVIPCLEGGSTDVLINTKGIIQMISEKFLSVTLDTGTIQANFATLNLSSPKVQTTAKALSPCYLRVGGTLADFMHFSLEPADPKLRKNPANRDTSFKKVKYANFSMTGKQWDELNGFAEAVGMDLIFDLNSLMRKDGLWLSENARLLMDYTVKKGYKIAGWELGNEPDVWRNDGYHINGSNHAIDYKILNNIINQYPQFKDAVIIGPSVTMLTNMYTYQYLSDFLKTGGPAIVTNPTFHHYYAHGPDMTVEKFMDPKLLDNLPEQINTAQNTAPHPPYGQFWLGETSSAWGGGAVHLSDRYVAGFMWLDKLGISASMGIGVVIRQDYYGGNYALIDTKTLDPNPDFWLSYVFKTLVGESVLNVTVQDKSGYVRMYAHCTNTVRSNYKPGSITVYGMNLKQEPTTVSFPDFTKDVKLDTYMLQPVGKDSLKSQTVALNGKTLKLNQDASLPAIPEPVMVTGSFTFPQESFGFIVIPDADASVCQ